jgi:radical SAM superfamily enzyme YgiQ (UPF0313 family)
MNTPPRAARHSLPEGDVVLVHAPPHGTQPWIAMGVVLHHAILARAGIRPRVVRLLDHLDSVPRGVLESSMFTFLRDPSMDDRLAAMAREQANTPAFFEGMLDVLLAGPEKIFAFSLWRNNADVSLWLAKLLKERRPSSFVILGGPEPIEETEPYRLPWVDAILGTGSEGSLLPLALAVLAGKPARIAALPSVWLNPALGADVTQDLRKQDRPPQSLPEIDYAPLIPLLVGDPNATIPILLNWGCPYNCAFCSNRNVYAGFAEGSIERVLREIDGIVEAWNGHTTEGLSIQFSDATTNALPQQFDEVMRRIGERQKSWPIRPMFRGQSLFDEVHMSAERARLMVEANFASTFFGLDAVSDDHRRALKKPGKIASVVRAMQMYEEGGGRGLFFGIPVGMPGETEAHHAEAARFLEWALTLEKSLEGITVLPYVFFRTAQGPTWNDRNIGERRGVLWRMEDPSGDPAERARRMMRLYERVDNRVETVTPFPHHMTLPMMLPAAETQTVGPWLARFGRVHQPLRERFEWRMAERASDERAAFGGLCKADIERALRAETPTGGWVLTRIDWLPQGMPNEAVVVHFAREVSDHEPGRDGDRGREERFVLVLERPVAGRPAFAVTGPFAVSYLNSWRGAPCGFDAGLMKFCTARVAEICVSATAEAS